MMAPSESIRRSLFNNPTLSDIKIRQKHNGEVKEFYAHKAVLCTHSEWFTRALTGQFKEASEPVIEINDDEPTVFQFMLQFFYNDHQDLASRGIVIPRNADHPLERHVFLPLRLYDLGEKYDAGSLRIWAAKTLEDNIADIHTRCNLTDEFYRVMVREHYNQCPSPGRTVGTLLAAHLARSRTDFITNDAGADLIQQLPVFAADILLAVRPKLWRTLKD